MKSKPNRALFAPGNITCSQAALAAMQAADTTGLSLIARHITGDWPDDELRAANQAVLDSGDDLPLISYFRFAGDIEIVITTMYPRTGTITYWYNNKKELSTKELARLIHSMFETGILPEIQKYSNRSFSI